MESVLGSKIKGMGELHGKGAVHFCRQALCISEIIVDDEQIIPWPVDIVQSKIDAKQIIGAVVLDQYTG